MTALAILGRYFPHPHDLVCFVRRLAAETTQVTPHSQRHCYRARLPLSSPENCKTVSRPTTRPVRS